jgi:hypothetical protein
MEERTKKSESHIHTSALYSDFKKWLINMNHDIKNIPSNKKFVKELRNSGTIAICDRIKIKKISSTGIKNLSLI